MTGHVVGRDAIFDRLIFVVCSLPATDLEQILRVVLLFAHRSRNHIPGTSILAPWQHPRFLGIPLGNSRLVAGKLDS